MDEVELRTLIEKSLRDQGFRVEDGAILPPLSLTKDKLRILHAQAVRHRISRAQAHLARYEDGLLHRLAHGRDLDPRRIEPRLIEVRRRSEDELLFRYVTLHWSIPVSSGYGRRLRFLVIDEQNDKLIGVIGLGDPVFSLGGRDRWIGWDKERKKQRLHCVMDAFALGAVPPYSFLLAGKLIAMLAASDEVRQAFKDKYEESTSIILGRRLGSQLALITTASALGRSSIYNRLRYREQTLFEPVGFTKGSGEFHFSNGMYQLLFHYATANCTPTAKHRNWGEGFRARREVVKRCLAAVGLSETWVYHGVKRELFAVPMARNTREFLRGEDNNLDWHDRTAEGLTCWFRQRWLLPRAERDTRYREFQPGDYRLWGHISEPAQ
jgi:hypothetical protein